MPQRKSQPTRRRRPAHDRRASAAAPPTSTRAQARRRRQPPRPLADDAAAQRARLRRLSPRCWHALARREGWTFRFYDEARCDALGAGAFLAVARANAHRGAGIVRLTLPAARRSARHAASRWSARASASTPAASTSSRTRSMYLMHGDMQGSAVAVGTLLALARRDAPLRHRLLARDHRERDRAARLPAAGSGARAERHHHPGRAQRCRGPHGAGRHAGAGRAREAAH